jgi:hypothetical protein
MMRSIARSVRAIHRVHGGYHNPKRKLTKAKRKLRGRPEGC